MFGGYVEERLNNQHLITSSLFKRHYEHKERGRISLYKFTQLITFPFRKLFTFATAILSKLCRASLVAHALWGLMLILGACNKGLSALGGSVDNTSTPANKRFCKSAAASAAYVAGVSAQVATTTALAGQAAFASTAAIPVVGPAAAPAAATAATAAASALGAPAITASAGVAGGRLYGGDVNAGSMYAVTEDGSPEIFQSDNGKQYMLPGTNGEVISNGNASGGGGMIVNININVDSGGESSTSTSGGGGAEELAEKFRAMTLTIMQEETSQGGILWNMQNERY